MSSCSVDGVASPTTHLSSSVSKQSADCTVDHEDVKLMLSPNHNTTDTAQHEHTVCSLSSAQSHKSSKHTIPLQIFAQPNSTICKSWRDTSELVICLSCVRLVGMTVRVNKTTLCDYQRSQSIETLLASDYVPAVLLISTHPPTIHTARPTRCMLMTE